MYCCPARRGPAGPAGPPGPPGPPTRTVVAGEPILGGERVIYADPTGLGFMTDGTETTLIAAIGITTGLPIGVGQPIPYVPVNGVREPMSYQLGWFGDCWAGPQGSLSRYQDLPTGIFTRRVGTSAPTRALFVDFGIVVEKTT